MLMLPPAKTATTTPKYSMPAPIPLAAQSPRQRICWRSTSRMEGLAKWAISLGLVALCADGISGSACPMHLAAVHGSVPDAVDGSSTGTRVPWMWVLLKAPRFEGANHGNDHDNRSRHRQIGFSGPRR